MISDNILYIRIHFRMPLKANGYNFSKGDLEKRFLSVKAILRKHFASFLKMSSNLNGIITKTCLYNFGPLKPHFYVVKLGFTGVYVIFLISAQNIDCGYSLEPPRNIDCGTR